MATMDFFEHQDQARKNTGRLVWMFVAAVVGIVAALYGVFLIVAAAGSDDPERMSDPVFHLGLLIMVGLAALVVIGGGSAYKVSQLRAGGSAVAEQLGGKVIPRDTRDAMEKKVLNVVDEMAIASGIPSPPVYLIEEKGINAFAAGFDPGSAVIGVTRGCVERLNRDQLQGVIAHEFSHILNGDMRLNIKLIGIVHGILIVGIIGYYLMRSALYARSSRGKNDGRVPIILIGLAVMIVGFIGTFFGNLIKAAVSRQREFLADASAVQFTRNPDGIGGALKVLAGYKLHGKVDHPNAPEISHMFFAQALASGLQSMFATHPPLEERIARIDPHWKYKKADMAAGAEPAATRAPAHAGASGFAGATGGGAVEAPAAPGGPTPTPPPAPARGAALRAAARGAAVAQIGQPTQAHLDYAHELIETLPKSVAEAAHEPYGARAVIYAMLLNDEAEARRAQVEQLRRHADQGVADLTMKIADDVAALDARARLPVIDMAIPALRQLTQDQYKAFRANVDVLVKADKKIELFEWALVRILEHHLAAEFERRRPPRVQYNRLGQVQRPIELLLSALAYIGHGTKDEAQRAFDAAAAHMRLLNLQLMAKSNVGLKELNQALSALRVIAPPLKRQVLNAAAACVAADHEVTIGEAELFRAIADTIDCPMPPMLPGQPLV